LESEYKTNNIGKSEERKKTKWDNEDNADFEYKEDKEDKKDDEENEENEENEEKVDLFFDCSLAGAIGKEEGKLITIGESGGVLYRNTIFEDYAVALFQNVDGVQGVEFLFYEVKFVCFYKNLFVNEIVCFKKNTL